jgi:membrane complex biogenesis BtpA family protein
MIPSWFRDLFAVEKPIIAMVHLPALPGRPRHDRSTTMEQVVESVVADVRALQEAGVDGLLFCNEADLPYQLRVGAEVAAAMAAVIGQVRRELSRPFGVDLVWDPYASLATARATGASFVREVFTGVYESDLGLMQPDYGSIAAYRQEIGAEGIALFNNITPEFASTIGERTIPERAQSAVYLGIDAILISGPITGTATNVRQLRDAKAAVPDTPVLANTGVRVESVDEILNVADGAIVGTTFKHDGVTWNAVDPARAASFMDAVRRHREVLAAR